MGKIPSGCSILTVRHDDASTGVLVSWVQQAAFEPIALSVAVRKGRPALSLIEQSRRFLLNVIGEPPTAMFRHFGRGFALGEDAFQGLSTEQTDVGVRLLDCIAWIACRVMTQVDVGDHELFIAQVEAAESGREGAPYTHLRKSGLTY